MKLIIFIVLVLCSVMASAHDVYKWVAPDGRVYFSDQPYTGADIFILPEWPPPQSYPHVMSPWPSATAKPVSYLYSRLTIIMPEHGEYVSSNEGNIQVTLAIEPYLNTTENHKIRVLLDGKVQGDLSPSLKKSLMGVARGRHQLTAQVINERGQILITSQPVGFYLKHASALFHPPRPGTAQTGVQQAPRAPMAPHAPRAPHAPFRPAITPPPQPGGNM